MRKRIIILLFVMAAAGMGSKAYGQKEELIQLALNIEKLAQFKKILTNLKKGYQIVNKGYTTIKDISEGDFNLHEAFLDGLLQVSPAIRNYKKIADIIRYQVILVREYKHAYNRFKENGNFSLSELDYISGVYNRLFQASLQNLDELTMVVTAGKLRMSDDERLQAIDRICDNMQDELIFLRDFNNSTLILALERAKTKNDRMFMQDVYGLTD